MKGTTTGLPEACDVLVVGAGPAGSCAAWAAARAGADTCLIEEDERIGTPVRCAEGISARAYRAFLGDPDPALVCTRIRRVRIAGPSGRGVIFDRGNVGGYILDRTRFDAALAGRAADAGARVLTATRAVGLTWSGGRWRVQVQRRGSGDTGLIAARVVVAADGIASRIGRRAGLDTRVSPEQMQSCCQYRLGDLELDPGTIELAFGAAIAPRGYAWIFPKGGGEANVGLGMVGRAVPGGGRAKEYLDRWVRARFPEATILAVTGGGLVIAPPSGRISSHGLLLAGDAARQINPLTGAGISTGMRGGWLAGTVAARACASGDTGARALHAYDRRWRGMLGRLHDDHRRLAEAVYAIPDERLDDLIEEVLARPGRRRSLAALVRVTLRRRPALMLRVVPYFRHWRAGHRQSGYPASLP